LDDESDERANGIGRTRAGSGTARLDREKGGQRHRLRGGCGTLWIREIDGGRAADAAIQRSERR